MAGAGVKALGFEAAGKALIRHAGFLAVGASLIDGVQASFASARTFNAGDYDAFILHGVSAVLVFGGAGFGISAIGASSLFGPAGIAIALIAAGVIFAWAAANAEDTQAEIWLDRCYFGEGERTEGKWTDREINKEMAQLNSIIVGLSGEIGFNDNWAWIEENLPKAMGGGYDTLTVRINFAHFDSGNGAYDWKLRVNHSDGREIIPLLGRHGLGRAQHYLSASPDEPEDTSKWFKNFEDRSYERGKSLLIEQSVDVDVDLFQSARLEVKYWPNYADKKNQASISIEASD